MSIEKITSAAGPGGRIGIDGRGQILTDKSQLSKRPQQDRQQPQILSRDQTGVAVRQPGDDAVFSHQRNVSLQALRGYGSAQGGSDGAKTSGADALRQEREAARRVVESALQDGRRTARTDGSSSRDDGLPSGAYTPLYSMLAGPGFGTGYAVNVAGVTRSPESADADATRAIRPRGPEETEIISHISYATSMDGYRRSFEEQETSESRPVSSSLAELMLSDAGSDDEKSAQGTGASQKSASGRELSESELKEIEELKARDKEVRTHEQAHKSAGGQYAGSPSYTTTVGPDGRRYVTDGEVSIDMSEGRTPEETIRKMQQVQRAAHAPAEPSPQDHSVYSEAVRKENAARAELSEEKLSAGMDAALRDPESEATRGVNGDRADKSDNGEKGVRAADATGSPIRPDSSDFPPDAPASGTDKTRHFSSDDSSGSEAPPPKSADEVPDLV